MSIGFGPVGHNRAIQKEKGEGWKFSGANVVQMKSKNALESLLRHFSAPLLGLEPRTP